MIERIQAYLELSLLQPRPLFLDDFFKKPQPRDVIKALEQAVKAYFKPSKPCLSKATVESLCQVLLVAGHALESAPVTQQVQKIVLTRQICQSLVRLQQTLKNSEWGKLALSYAFAGLFAYDKREQMYELAGRLVDVRGISAPQDWQQLLIQAGEFDPDRYKLSWLALGLALDFNLCWSDLLLKVVRLAVANSHNKQLAFSSGNRCNYAKLASLLLVSRSRATVAALARVMKQQFMADDLSPETVRRRAENLCCFFQQNATFFGELRGVLQLFSTMALTFAVMFNPLTPFVMLVFNRALLDQLAVGFVVGMSADQFEKGAARILQTLEQSKEARQTLVRVVRAGRKGLPQPRRTSGLLARVIAAGLRCS